MAAVATLGALAVGCAVGPAANRGGSGDPSAEEEQRPGGGGDDEGPPPLSPDDPSEDEPEPGPTSAPATGSATAASDPVIDEVGDACCLAQVPDSEDLLIASGDTVFLHEAEGDGELTPLGDIPGDVLGLAVPRSATGSFVSVVVSYASASGLRVDSYTYFPAQEWAPWGPSSAPLLDDPIPLAGDGTRGGGALAFGPGGALFLGTGDAGDPALAEDEDSLAGKILELDPNGSDPPVVHSPGPYADVRGIAWDQDRMWVVDAADDGGARLFSVVPEGDPVDVRELPGEVPMGLAASEGSLWMPGGAEGTLWRIPLHGTRLVADPAAVLDLAAPGALLTDAGSTDLLALGDGGVLRLTVE
ncbi:PQQ-dependent sugar dehydrogenase [Streptomyces radicis]|uniref:Glucose/Sorbosone dehydrogenase domain-containing protein n=1 Tax=Streptomyces radicis TaxID=1750517 RepID=A0A3A9WAX1_9ACTN|nr:PQQ-dependent sugar dehydrogenase [Streptomyces radicis]RKN09782.1 hypothetical protein D7319_12115 [Streptomyces radicis]RKN23419.1 hypothetical protein D7318_13070 [Streptomyces radicis]